MGSIPDGVYDIQDDTLKVIKVSRTSPETLQSLIGLLEALKRGEASISQVIDRVEQDAPALAPTVRQALAKSEPSKWITLLIAIITLYLQATTAQPPSADEVAEAIREKPIPTYSLPAPPAEAKLPGKSKVKANSECRGPMEKPSSDKSRNRR